MYFNFFLKSVFTLILLFFLFVEAKDNDGKKFMCADEVGPVINFTIPDFETVNEEIQTSIKIYDKTDRSNFSNQNSIMKKKTSPIDESYFFYSAEFMLYGSQGYFEFFPPSHLLIKNQELNFQSLVCWE